MNIFDEYLHRSQEVIGNRTQAEEKYDNEVIKSLSEGVDINAAIEKANKKYPEEALKIDAENIADVALHYEYLKDHLAITQKVNQMKKRSK